MLEFLQGKVSDRKLRLFAVACCQRIWHFLPDERSRLVVELAGLYADGEIDYSTLGKAGQGTQRSVIRHLLLVEAWEAADFVSLEILFLVSDGWDEAAGAAEEDAQCRLLRDMFCPFWHGSVHSSKSKANKGQVRKLARTIYDERCFNRLPELADALEAARCTDAELLAHLRSPGPHIRGCWALDAVLG
jgi:hypothetical protein